MEAIKGEIQRKSIEQNTARLNITQARERMEEEAGSAASLRTESTEIEGQIQEIRRDKETIRQELAESEALEARTQEEITLFGRKLEEERKLETEALRTVSEWELKVDRMRQALGFKQSNVERIDGEIAKSRDELAEILEALETNRQEMERRQQNIVGIEETIAVSFQTQSNSEGRLKEAMAHKEELSARQKSFFSRREELSEKLSALDKETYRLNAQKEKLEESLESQINYMWDEYEITLSDAAALRNEEMTDPARHEEGNRFPPGSDQKAGRRKCQCH